MRTQKYNIGFTLVEIMIFVAVIALLALLAVPKLQHEKIVANDSLAKSTLRAISIAAESYKKDHDESYPANALALVAPLANPPYLNTDYCTNSPRILGYYYTCNFSRKGYKITATPVVKGSTGTREETITTGSVLTP
ncbi:MAG: prepilin-type N-terminal cleavage/methylation domain-containing protein [Candidatus Omnitrophica bacterium]|nr:prepilin-type N-terminal cleavage/methylation domain-containing protein [Candidatus Omnitrophota bacterium]